MGRAQRGAGAAAVSGQLRGAPADGADSAQDEVFRELRDFVNGRPKLPTHAEFVAAGKKSLYARASRIGGIDHWRRVFQAESRGAGIAELRRRSEEMLAIAAELEAYIATRGGRFPRLAQMDRDGRRELREAVERTGGARFWKRFLHEMQQRRIRADAYKLEQAIEEARGLLRKFGYLPTAAVLRDHGHDDLAGVFDFYGSPRAFAELHLR
jgi:hypothetical protein